LRQAQARPNKIAATVIAASHSTPNRTKRNASRLFIVGPLARPTGYRIALQIRRLRQAYARPNKIAATVIAASHSIPNRTKRNASRLFNVGPLARPTGYRIALQIRRLRQAYARPNKIAATVIAASHSTPNRTKRNASRLFNVGPLARPTGYRIAFQIRRLRQAQARPNKLRPPSPAPAIQSQTAPNGTRLGYLSSGRLARPTDCAPNRLPLQTDRGTLPATDTQRRDAPLLIQTNHIMQQGHHDARTGTP